MFLLPSILFVLVVLATSAHRHNDGPGVGDNSATEEEAEQICASFYDNVAIAAACGELKKWVVADTAQRKMMVSEYLNSVQGDDPEWCGSFVNFVMAKAGLEHTNSPLAASWLDVGRSTPEPVVGSVVVYDWDQLEDDEGGVDEHGKYHKDPSSTSAHSSHGHAAIVVKVDTEGNFFVIGGNQKCHGDSEKQVCIKKYQSDYSEKRIAGFQIVERLVTTTTAKSTTISNDQLIKNF